MGLFQALSEHTTARLDLSRIIPLLMLIAVAVIFGAMFSVNRVAATNGVPPIAYAFWQSLGAGIVLLAISWARGHMLRVSPVYLRTYFVSGALGIGIPISLLAYVAANLPASVVTLVLALSPPLTYLFALLLRMERFRWLSILGILLGLCGVLLVILPDTSLPAADMAGWLLLALLAPVCFAVVNVFAGRFRPPQAPSSMLACGLLLVSALFLLPIMLGSGQAYLFPGPEPVGDCAIGLATLINVFFWVLFFEIIRLAGSVFFAQFNYLAVLAGIGWAILIFDDRPSAYVWGALVLLFAGLALIHVSATRPPASPSPSSRDQG